MQLKNKAVFVQLALAFLVVTLPRDVAASYEVSEVDEEPDAESNGENESMSHEEAGAESDGEIDATSHEEADAESNAENETISHEETDAEPNAENEAISYMESEVFVEENEPEITEDEAKKIHAGVDVNKDGMVSKSELVAYSVRMQQLIDMQNLNETMDHIDLDHDGKLSLEEIVPREGMEDEELRKVEEQKFKLADRNGNGFLEIDEVPAMMIRGTHDGIVELATRQTLEEKDKDGDGQLTPKEFLDMTDDADDVGADVAMLEQDGNQSSLFEDGFFQVLDKDGNGKLSMVELKAFDSGHADAEMSIESFFELTDVNDDKHLTLEELKGARSSELKVWAQHSDM